MHYAVPLENIGTDWKTPNIFAMSITTAHAVSHVSDIKQAFAKLTWNMLTRKLGTAICPGQIRNVATDYGAVWGRETCSSASYSSNQNSRYADGCLLTESMFWPSTLAACCGVYACFLTVSCHNIIATTSCFRQTFCRFFRRIGYHSLLSFSSFSCLEWSTRYSQIKLTCRFLQSFFISEYELISWRQCRQLSSVLFSVS